jgi:hypothetical protein
VRFRDSTARVCDRDARLLAKYGKWRTRFAWFAWLPVRIPRGSERVGGTGRWYRDGGTDWVWLGRYRARYVRKLGDVRDVVPNEVFYWILARHQSPRTWA